MLISVTLSAKKYDIANLTNNDGLSNSSINNIYQDANGLMWFGSWDGLNAYNGREFKVFKPEPGNAQSISNNIIRDIVEENKGIHWIATDRGINRMDMRKKTFDRFFVDGEYQTISSEHSFLIAKNSSNIIFAGINEKGLFFFDSKTHRFVHLSTVKNYRLKKMFFDQDDNLWLFTNEKTLLKVVFKKGGSTQPKIGNIVDFRHLKGIESVFYNSNNEIWMQTAGGALHSYRISEGLLNDFPIELPKTGIIKAIIFMDSYQLWGTTNGLFRFDPDKKQVELVLPNVSVLSLCRGTQQIVWVGTDMQGVWQLSPSRDTFRSYSAENIPSFGNSAVRTFFEDPDHLLWVGTKGSGIYTVSQNSNNTKSLSNQHFTTANGLLSNSVFTIVKGQGNEYWIGTDGRGINYYDIKTKKIQVLTVPGNILQNVNLTSVYSILPTEKATLWVGTSGYGM
jgi:ligand-binding sensor domain-containing protein